MVEVDAGLRGALLETVQGLMSPNQVHRAQAEEQVKALEVGDFISTFD